MEIGLWRVPWSEDPGSKDDVYVCFVSHVLRPWLKPEYKNNLPIFGNFMVILFRK